MSLQLLRTSQILYPAMRLPSELSEPFVKQGSTVNHPFLFCGRRSVLLVNAPDSGLSGRLRALAGDIGLCSWARHYSHSDSRVE